MRVTIRVEETGLVRIKDTEIHPTPRGGSRHPFMLGPECTLEYVRSDLLGLTIVVADGEGRPLYAVNVGRPGIYIIDEHGHTYVEVNVASEEPALA